MNTTTSNLAIRRQLAQLTHTDAADWHLCMRARYGMAVVFDAIAAAEKSTKSTDQLEILTTPFTCSTAVNPILVAGLTPVYADLNTHKLDLKNPANSLSARTRAIMMQHTYGVIGDKTPYRTLANKHKLLLIEDSAHCLARLATDPSTGKPLADISIHSFGVEKVLPTKFGGAIYLNPSLQATHPDLYLAIIQTFANLPRPSLALALRIRLYRPLNALLRVIPLKRHIRRLAIRTRLLEPAVAPQELSGRQSQPLATNNFINRQILRHLPSLPANQTQRTKITALYTAELNNTQYLALPNTANAKISANPPNHAQAEPLLAFPILCQTPDHATQLHAALTAKGFFIRRWYSPLFYPGAKTPRTYHYDPATCPIAESTHPRILGLPTNITIAQARQILKIIQNTTKI